MTYTEDVLIEQPAIKLYFELGWETLECWDEEFGAESYFGRDNRGDVVLPVRLRSSCLSLILCKTRIRLHLAFIGERYRHEMDGWHSTSISLERKERQ